MIIDGLPETEETLWLRLMGRGATRRRAIAQLLELPVEHPLRGVTVDILATRFGTIDEALREAIEHILGTPTLELTRLLLQASREELIAK